MSIIDKDIQDLFRYIEDNNFIALNDFPNIDLYMDQVTRFFETHIQPYGATDDERILTKTMINNYVKHKVISAPERKKYAKDQVILLVLVYSLKHALSISDIKALLTPLREASDANNTRQIESLYEKLRLSQTSLLSTSKEQLSQMADDILGPAPKNEEIMELIFGLALQSSINKQLAEILIHKHFPSKDKEK